MSEYLLKSNGLCDVGCQLNKIITQMNDGDILTLEEGATYHIYPEHCFKEFYYISNNDASLKEIAIYLKGLNNVCVNGNNSKLVFHGRICPIILDGCENIKIENLKVDYADTFHLEIKITGVMRGVVEGEISKVNNYYIDNNGYLVLTGDTWEGRFDEQTYAIVEFFDEKEKKPADGVNYHLVYLGKDKKKCTAEEFVLFESLGGRKVRLSGIKEENCKVGQVMTINGEKRYASICYSVNCKNLSLKNVEIYYSTAMGIICQTCENVNLEGIKVLCTGEHGHITTNADATHFVACSGKVSLKECFFENMMDDACNVHGIFNNVIEVDGNKLVVSLEHYQQYGVNPYFKGDEVWFYKEKHLKKLCSAKVVSSRLLDEKRIELVVEGDVSSVSVGDQTENYSRYPELHIDSIVVRNNRPRSILVATNKRAVIENCYFSNSGNAVSVSADNYRWYESGGITDLTIQNNTIYRCCYQGGGYNIMVCPEYIHGEEEVYYCKNIKIYNNKFFVDKTQMFLFIGTDTIETKGNVCVDYLTGEDLTASDKPLVYYCKNINQL